MFECSSAAGTVGVTAGITPYLSAAGKVVLIICMFLGRLGPITVMVALSVRQHSREENIDFPKELVIF